MEKVLSDAKERVRDMADRVITLIGITPEIPEAVPIIGIVKLEIQSILDEISQESGDRYKAKNESVGEMPEVKLKLAHSTVVIAKLVLGYGQRNDIAEIKNICNISESDLIRTPYGEVVDKVKQVIDLAKKYLPLMTEYALTQEDITNLENNMNEYSAELKTTGEEHIEGVSLTEELDDEFTRLWASVHSLDSIVDGLQDKYPEFHNLYKKARKVYHFGVRHRIPGENLSRKKALIARRQQKIMEKKAALKDKNLNDSEEPKPLQAEVKEVKETENTLPTENIKPENENTIIQ